MPTISIFRPPKKTAGESLEKTREDFFKLQMKVEREMELECSRHKK